MAEFIYQMYKARKAHGDKVILDDVTLSFYPGAKIGVVGPNGMGKSTLLKLMAGMEEVSNGEARLTPGYTVGILQQGATWGSPEERMSPAVAAKRFYSAMISVDGWETMPASELAGLVQRSAWPDSYVDDEPAARRFYRDYIDDVRVSRCAASHADTGAALVGAPS